MNKIFEDYILIEIKNLTFYQISAEEVMTWM